jgi:hypothetical protein
MTVSELIDQLSDYLPDIEVMILDGFNGGGTPRTINLGPRASTITPKDAEDAADCEDRVGEPIVVLGYGCY